MGKLPINFSNLCIGVLLAATTISVILFEWTGQTYFSYFSSTTLMLVMVALSFNIGRVHRTFLVVGVILVLLAFVRLTDWSAAIKAALVSASFIVAFFIVLMTMRTAAAGSAAMAECGRYLAEQPPGRRYLALTLGGQLFGLIMIYGAISVLGSMAEASANREPDLKIRAIRLRRMLLAIQRGLISILPWSPVAFCMAITTSVVPGATWGNSVLPCLISGLLLAGIGWGVDTIGASKRIALPVNTKITKASLVNKMAPLLLLLAILAVTNLMLYALTDVRFAGIVMLTVPSIAIGWMLVQTRSNQGSVELAEFGSRCKAFATNDLPGMRGEVVLLAMAGFIGALGSSLLSPVVANAGLDLTGVPVKFLLICVFFLIPVTGQLGMNPILSVSLIAPLLPTPEVMSISPSAVVVAITAGWALSGATSPYTASTLLVAYFGKVSATRVGLQWNCLFVVVSLVCLSGWICIAADLLP